MVALSLQQGQDAPSVLSDLELARQLQHEEYQQHHPHPQPGPSQPLPAQVIGFPPRCSGCWWPSGCVWGGGVSAGASTPQHCPCPRRWAGERPESGGSRESRIWTVPSCSTSCPWGPRSPPSPRSASSREIVWAGADTRMRGDRLRLPQDHPKLPSGLNTKGSHSGGAPSGGVSHLSPCSETRVDVRLGGDTCTPPVQNVALALGK